MAFVLAALLAGLWHMVLEWGATLDHRNPSNFWTVTGFAVVVSAVQAATSLPFLASAIGGFEAVRHHQERSLNDLSRIIDGIAAASEHQLRLQGVIAREREGMSDLRLQETLGTGPSRQAGDGPVARLIAQAIDVLGGAGRAAELQTDQVDLLLQTARADIAAARTASLIGDDAVFVRILDAVQTRTVEAQGLLGGGVAGGFDLSGSPLAEVRDSGARIAAAAQMLPGPHGVIRAAPYEHMSRPRAVLTYPEAVPLAWSVAVAIDALPLVLLVLLLLSARTRDDEPEPPLHAVRQTIVAARGRFSGR